LNRNRIYRSFFQLSRTKKATRPKIIPPAIAKPGGVGDRYKRIAAMKPKRIPPVIDIVRFRRFTRIPSGISRTSSSVTYTLTVFLLRNVP
jgi:hypothetical protein